MKASAHSFWKNSLPRCLCLGKETCRQRQQQSVRALPLWASASAHVPRGLGASCRKGRRTRALCLLWFKATGRIHGLRQQLAGKEDGAPWKKWTTSIILGRPGTGIWSLSLDPPSPQRKKLVGNDCMQFVMDWIVLLNQKVYVGVLTPSVSISGDRIIRKYWIVKVKWDYRVLIW